MEFKTVIVIGYGVIAGKVLDHVISLKNKYGYSIIGIEHEIYPFNSMEEVCRKTGIKFFRSTKKHEIERLLDSKSKTLIISAGNNYIFSDKLIANSNNTIINFHNALLPKYPGRNAPTWVIYYEEKESGATWHYVNKTIDTGDIMIQKSCAINPDMKAYQLSDVIMKLAYEAFIEIFELLIKGRCQSYPQALLPNQKLYLSKEIPGNGKFQLDYDPSYIYRLLRSTDYGKNGVFPKIKTSLNGDEIEIIRYKKVLMTDVSKAFHENHFVIDQEKHEFSIRLDEKFCLKLKYNK